MERVSDRCVMPKTTDVKSANKSTAVKWEGEYT